MKTKFILVLFVFGLVVACQQFEEITDRRYPFVESIGISDLDESGVTVNFEIRKNGSSPITSYGLEYWIPTLNGGQRKIQRITLSGSPESQLASLRISYDMIKSSYLVHPFVEVKGSTVYGEILTFESLGVNPPKITDVTPREIKFIDRIHIQGDFFNSDIASNEVKILGLENKFTLNLDSVNNKNIWLNVILKDFSFQPSEEKYDLQVESGGKVTLLEDVISVYKPQISSVEPRRVYVGDSLEVSLNFFQIPEGLTFDLTSESGKVVSTYSYVLREAGKYKFLVQNTESGQYGVSINSIFWKAKFPEKIEVLPSWEIYKSGVQVPNLSEYEVVSTPDRLLFIGKTSQTQGKFHVLNLGSGSTQTLPDLPGEKVIRDNPVMIGTQGRYFYFGLGSVNKVGEITHKKDFYRFDFQTSRWEQLTDFPFEFSSVNKAVELNGKVYLVMNNYLNFREYDPVADTWTLTPVGVPSSLRNTAQFVQVGSEIYSVSTVYPLRLVAYRYGQDERWLPELYIQGLDKTNGLTFWDGNFIFTSEGKPEFRMDLRTLTLRPLQRVGEYKTNQLPLWQSKDGLLVPFFGVGSSGFQENVIYRLLQEFE